jgi:hypothetical protein
LPEGTEKNPRKTPVKIAGVGAEICTENFPTMVLESYGYASSLGEIMNKYKEKRGTKDEQKAT